MPDYQGITRTVCIGIGGTGEEVLTRIRKLIVDRYGSLNALPVVSFVHIDTDNAATFRGGNNYRGTDIGFRENETVKAVISAAEANAISRGIKEANEDPTTLNPHSHLAMWFPPQLSGNIPAIERGAQARRPIGRLAFSQNYQQFQQVITNAVERTAGHEGFLVNEHRLNLDAGINFFVVASLCGGTGSGMFLDVAYAIRGIYAPDQAVANIKLLGYLVISPQIYGDTPRQYANCYAALKELDYYSSEHTKFQICYRQDDNKSIVQESRPPFDFTYLVSRDAADNNYMIPTKEKLCNAIAQKISLDFLDESAPIFKSLRDNFSDYMQQLDTHPRTNCQQYMAFGLASLYFPKERIISIAQFEVGCKLTEFWLNGIGQRPDPQALVNQFLVDNAWHPNLNQKDGFVSNLEKTPLEGDKSFKKIMGSARDALKAIIDECKTDSDRQALPNTLNSQFNNRLRKVLHSDTETERGEWITKLQKARPSIEAKYKQDIENFIAELLNPSNLQFSIGNARSWIEAMQSEISSYRQDIEQEIIKLDGAKTLEDLQKQVKSISTAINESSNEFEFPFSGTRNRKVKEKAQTLVNTGNGLVEYNFKLAIHQESLKICKSLISAIEEQLSDLNSLHHSCQGLSNRYHNSVNERKEFNSDEINGEAIYTDTDIERCCKILMPEGQEKADLVLLTQNTLSVFGKEKSLIGLKTLTEEDLSKEVSKVLGNLLSPRMTAFSGSVIKLFEKKYTALESQRIRLRQLLSNGDLLLPLSLSADYYQERPEKSTRVVGFKKNIEEREITNFKRLLEDNEVTSGEQIQTTKEDEVLIVKEYGGFPIRIIRGINNFKFQYEKEKQHANFWLHNDRRISFPDVIPPEATALQKLQDIFYPCLALGIISRNENPNGLKFSYYNNRRKANVSEDLSPNWNFALDQIILNRDLQTSLLVRLEELINSTNLAEWKSKHCHMLVRFIQEVDSFTDNEENYRSKDLILGSSNPDSPNRIGIIDRFDKKVQDRLLHQQSNKVITSSNESEIENIESSVVDVEIIQNDSNINPELEKKLEYIKDLLMDGDIDKQEYLKMKEKLMQRYQS
jgi:hypothetical protein